MGNLRVLCYLHFVYLAWSEKAFAVLDIPLPSSLAGQATRGTDGGRKKERILAVSMQKRFEYRIAE